MRCCSSIAGPAALIWSIGVRMALLGGLNLEAVDLPSSWLYWADLYSDATFSRLVDVIRLPAGRRRSEEHTSELQSLMRISYAVFCLKKKKKIIKHEKTNNNYLLKSTIINVNYIYSQTTDNPN